MNENLAIQVSPEFDKEILFQKNQVEKKSKRRLNITLRPPQGYSGMCIHTLPQKTSTHTHIGHTLKHVLYAQTHERKKMKNISVVADMNFLKIQSL